MELKAGCSRGWDTRRKSSGISGMGAKGVMREKRWRSHDQMPGKFGSIPILIRCVIYQLILMYEKGYWYDSVWFAG